MYIRPRTVVSECRTQERIYTPRIMARQVISGYAHLHAIAIVMRLLPYAS
jgi:hypothetical protein